MTISLIPPQTLANLRNCFALTCRKEPFEQCRTVVSIKHQVLRDQYLQAAHTVVLGAHVSLNLSHLHCKIWWLQLCWRCLPASIAICSLLLPAPQKLRCNYRHHCIPLDLWLQWLQLIAHFHFWWKVSNRGFKMATGTFSNSCVTQGSSISSSEF